MKCKYCGKKMIPIIESNKDILICRCDKEKNIKNDIGNITSVYNCRVGSFSVSFDDSEVDNLIKMRDEHAELSKIISKEITECLECGSENIEHTALAIKCLDCKSESQNGIQLGYELHKEYAKKCKEQQKKIEGLEKLLELAKAEAKKLNGDN